MRLSEIQILLMLSCLLVLSCQLGRKQSAGDSPEQEPPGAFNSLLPRSAIYNRIKAAVDSIRLIDTHEHQVSEKLWLSQKTDLFYWIVQPWGFTQNTDSDLLSAGLTEQDRAFIADSNNDAEARWQKLAPFWAWTKYTSYAKPVKIAARDIYGIDDINESTWRILNEKIISAKKPGYRENLFHNLAGIDLMILDKIVWVDSSLAEGPPPRTVMVKRFGDYTLEDNFIQLRQKDIPAIADKYGVQLDSLDHLLLALDKAFEDIIRKGYYVGLKCAMAYDRKIYYEDTPREVAEKIFQEIKSGEVTSQERRPFEDFMMHQVIRRAGQNGLPVQIHTGCQLGPGNDITNARPTLLLNLFQKYPETKFVLFHGGFPYMGELTALVKNYANVYLDMCLMPVFSMSVTKQWLHVWLETLPVNKINLFGGDCLFPEGTYGHSVMARQIAAETLTEKVLGGYLTVEEALFVARRILRENAIEIYRLDRFLPDMQSRQE